MIYFLFLPHLQGAVEGEIDVDIVTDKSGLETIIEDFKQDELEFEIMTQKSTNDISSLVDKILLFFH